MNRLVLLQILRACTVCIVVIFVAACSEQSDTKHFSDTYGQILLLREQIADTSVANAKVDSILKANGYTKASFKETFQELSKSPESFRKMMDSVRTSIRPKP